MKNIFCFIVITLLFILCLSCGEIDIDPRITPEPTARGTPEPTPNPTFVPGSVWLTCSKRMVFEGDDFSFAVHVNTGEQKLCEYQIEIGFINSILRVRTESGNNGVEGFYSSVDSSTPGSIIINWNNEQCLGPNSDQILLIIDFEALKAGISNMDVDVVKLLDTGQNVVGIPHGIDYEITVFRLNVGWNCRYGDMRRTCFYPHESNEINLDTFIYKWHTGRKYNSMLTGDVTGDEKLEIVCMTENLYLTILSHDGNLIYSTDLNPKNAALSILADVDSDEKKEIGIGTYPNRQLECFFHEADGTQIKRLKKSSLPPTGGEDSGCIPHFYWDGKVLVEWYSGWARYPRGISLFDYETGIEEWYYCTGAVVRNFSIADMNGDGYYEITTSGDTPHNGADCNDTNDSQMYVIIVNEDGSRRISHELVDSQKGCHLEGWLYTRFLDFDIDGIMEILAFEQHRQPYYPGMSRLHKVNSDDGSILDSYDVGDNECITIGLVEDKIAIANEDTRTVKILDYSFNEIASNQVGTEGVPIYLTAINDVNGDGNYEIFIVSGNTFYLLNETLNVLWTYSYNGNNITGAIPSDLDCDGNNEIILSTEGEIVVIGY